MKFQWKEFKENILMGKGLREDVKMRGHREEAEGRISKRRFQRENFKSKMSKRKCHRKDVTGKRSWVTF